MSPADEHLTRGEFEERLDKLRSDLTHLNTHQDQEWNKGFRAVREDLAGLVQALRDDMRQASERSDRLLQEILKQSSDERKWLVEQNAEERKQFVTTQLLDARLSPVQGIAYGALGLVTTALVALLAAGHH